MKVSLIIPFIAESGPQANIVRRCDELASQHRLMPRTEICLIDNGSTYRAGNWSFAADELMVNDKNTGVLQTFKQGYELATGDIICFIHSDVLLHESGWDQRIANAFEIYPRLGLAGLFGARAVHPNGGREFCMSNMLGREWGMCDCHEVAADHHGVREAGIKPAAVFDGVGLFFRRETLRQLVEETDMFADWRAPHHFYDRIMSCKVADLGWHMAVIGIGFDHWSGATANSSEVYNQTALNWLERHRESIAGGTPDQHIYNIAEQQFFEEFSKRLPLRVMDDYSYRWQS